MITIARFTGIIIALIIATPVLIFVLIFEYSLDAVSYLIDCILNKK